LNGKAFNLKLYEKDYLIILCNPETIEEEVIQFSFIKCGSGQRILFGKKKSSPECAGQVPSIKSTSKNALV